MPIENEIADSRSMGEFLGYVQCRTLSFSAQCDLATARQMILGKGKVKVGRGMYAGTITAKVSGGKVRLRYFTQTLGPIFEGRLRESPDGGVLLVGRFRMTAIDMLACLMIQIGFMSWMVQFAREHLESEPVQTVGMIVFATLGLFIFPRFSWLSRGKMEGMERHLTRLGFTPLRIN